jgi:succinate dehydrogenase / fumarate reductase cytochrome b subunit
LNFFSSTIGKKVVVALTGLVLLGFVMGHLLGNLQIFLGPQKLNDYAAFLRHAKGLLWGTRITLMVSIVLHIIATVQLTLRNRQSRPVPYKQVEMVEASPASRTMIWGGLFLAFYIVFHISHLTFGVTHPHFDETDVYANVVNGFLVWPVALIYIAGMIALGLHLYHGVWSVFQTLGLNHPKYNCWRRCLATGAAVIISMGYMSIPVAVLTGIVR